VLPSGIDGQKRRSVGVCSGSLNLKYFIQPEQLWQLPWAVEAGNSDQFSDEFIVLHWVSSFLMQPSRGLLIVETPLAAPFRDIWFGIF
jgi:hypothetical protein